MKILSNLITSLNVNYQNLYLILKKLNENIEKMLWIYFIQETKHINSITS